MAKDTQKAGAKTRQLVNFRLRDEEFGVDISSVREITKVGEITQIPEAPRSIRGVTNLRGQIIPVIDLAGEFGLSPQERLPETARIVVAEIGDRTVGILVDEVPEVLKLAEEKIETPPELMESDVARGYVRGVGKLDHRLILVLDLEKVLANHAVTELSGAGSRT
jgi:purine-binding chemotaxis protein CheW